jgi:hypothetical protein
MILEIGKKSRQKLEQRASQLPSLLGAVLLYQILAFPSKEKGKSFHLRVLSDMPLIWTLLIPQPAMFALITIASAWG